VAARLKGTTIGVVFGNHGMEPWQATPAAHAVVEACLPVLHDRLAALQGVVVEDKRYSLAIHYRRSRSKRMAKAAILAAAAALPAVRVVGGKQVVNLLPAAAPTKGSALLQERDHSGCDTALFVGDDETDEDVFTLEQPGRLVTIRVGRSSRSAASYYLTRQSDIDALLEFLVGLRMQTSRPRAS
jgi:trehalose 6-phosphate phosphatase